MVDLNIPEQNIEIKSINSKNYIFDLIRKKHLVLTPEEWVRQNLVSYFINDLNYPKGIAEDESVFFPLIALSENTVINKKSYYKYRANRPGSITMESIKPIHAEDYLNRVLFTLNFMNLKKELINLDYSAWCFNLERKSLKYINLCLKLKKKISWKIIVKIFFKTKNLFFLLKIFWRILRNNFRN